VSGVSDQRLSEGLLAIGSARLHTVAGSSGQAKASNSSTRAAPGRDRAASSISAALGRVLDDEHPRAPAAGPGPAHRVLAVLTGAEAAYFSLGRARSNAWRAPRATARKAR